MKRTLSLLLALALLLAPLPGCRQESGPVSPTPSDSAPPERPTAAPTPEPATGMALVRDAMLDCCRDELAGLEGYTVTMFEDGEDFFRLIEEDYGIDRGLVTDGFAINVPAIDGFTIDGFTTDGFPIIGSGGLPLEILVLRTNIEDWDSALELLHRPNHSRTAQKLDAALMRYLEKGGQHPQKIQKPFGDGLYRPGGTSKLSGTIFMYFMCCQNFAETSQAIGAAIDQYCLEQSQSEPPATPQPVEVAEGVYFIDVSPPGLKGEQDPDHPGRARYTQPNQDDMSLYDTSAILAAWEGGDPAGLSAYDRAIYDSAQDVLGGVLTEGMDDFSKETAIYEWVIQNVAYDWTHTDVMAETPRESFTPYGGLVNRKAVCLGYAATFQLLAELAGMECITVVGAAAGGDHAWNQIRLDGEWYCADVAWEIPYWTDGTMNGREWRYFNTTSDYMALTNHQWDYDNVPEATAEDHGRP